MMRRSNVDAYNKHKGSGIVGDIAGKALGAVSSLASAGLNKTIDLLPVELHIPGYRFCGPGTRLRERLERGDRPINPLDAACKQHDIAYYTYSDSKNRSEADRRLADLAWERVKSSDASAAEKAAAWSVTNLMKIKSKLGGGVRKRQLPKSKGQTDKKGKGVYLRPYSQPKTGCGYSRRSKTIRGKARGKGVYLRPYSQPKTGCCNVRGKGVYLRPYSQPKTGCGNMRKNVTRGGVSKRGKATRGRR